MNKPLFIFIGAMLAGYAGMSQDEAISHAFWVIETHERDTIYSVVRFFDGNNELLHEFRIENVAIDIQRRKSRKKLDQLLASYKQRAALSAKKARPRTSA